MAQEQFKAQPAQGTTEEETETPAPAGPSAAAHEQVQAVDDLLDEIDGVLERNAEEFVRGFVQKGGQ